MDPARPHCHYRREVVACLALALLTLAAFGPICSREYDFVNFDDDEYVTGNPHVQAGLTPANFRWAWTTFHAFNWHPLTWLSLQCDAQLFGLDPRGFHLTNVVLHVASSIVLFLVLRGMTGAVWRSALVAALFALHPLHVESVAWVSERKDVLSGLFWMLTLAAYVGYARRPGPVRYLLLLVIFALGLLAKPMLVTLPCVLLLLDYWPLRRWEGHAPEASAAFPPASLRRLIAEKLPLLALAVASSCVTVVAQRGVVKTWEEFPLRVRVLNALVAYVAYLGKTFCPSGLAVLYPHPGAALPSWPAIAAAVLLAAITGLALWQARTRPYLSVGWLWYLGTLVPVIGLVQIGLQAYADRYTYVPLVGIFVIVAWGLGDLAARGRELRNVAVLLGGGAVMACLVVTMLQVRHWRSSVTLWEHTLAVTSGNAVAHDSLGSALAQQGKTQAALAHFRDAVRIRPDYPDAQYKLAMLLLGQGKAAEARVHAEAALKSSPDDPRPRTCLGLAQLQEGQTDEAARTLEEVVQAHPDFALAVNGLGEARLRQGRVTDALACFLRAAALQPADVLYQSNLAAAYAESGRYDEAISAAERALALASAADRPDQVREIRARLERYRQHRSSPPQR
jgi:Flp pilus assembly protein TadD